MKFLHFKSYLLTLAIASALAMSQSASAEQRFETRVLDYPYGVALFQFFQNNPLAAITEIDVGKYRAAFEQQPDEAELLLGGLYFSYGLVDAAEQIFNDLLQSEKPQATQDLVWFNLARVQFELGNFEQSAELLNRIANPLPLQREQQRQYLLTDLQIKHQQFEQAAENLNKISTDNIWRAYAQYNLSVAQVAAGQKDAGYAGFSKLEELNIKTEEFYSLLDSSELALGLNNLRQENNDAAIEHFLKVRFSGPISNRALLGIGWAWSQNSDLDKAIGYWRALQKKTQIDRATLESYLAIPYALELKQRKTQAIEFYRQAAANYDRLLQELDNLIIQVEKDYLIDTLIQYRIVDNTSINQLKQTRLVPNSANFLYTLIADNEFQQQVRHYQELLDILDTLLKWDENIPTLGLMLKERRASFERKRPAITNASEHEQLAALLAQYEQLAHKVAQIERDQDYLALANSSEAEYQQQLDEVKSLLEQLDGQQDLEDEKDKYRLLRGLLNYQIETDYPTRYWHVKREFKALSEAIQQTKESALSFSLAAATNDTRLQQFDERIAGQDTEINRLLTQVDSLLGRQKNAINQLAINAIQQQQQNIRQLRLSARYSLARLYDDLVSEKSNNE